MYTKEKRNQHLWIIVVLTVLTFGLISIFNSGSVNLAGEYIDQRGVNTAALKTLIFTVPIVGFILGALVAIIPFKGMTYKQKYLRASLLTIIVLDSVLLVATVYQNLLT